MLTPEQRVLRARKAGLTTHARHDSKAIAARARNGFLARFEREVDPDGQLPPEERLRRAKLARKAYMTGLALKSSQARRTGPAA